MSDDRSYPHADVAILTPPSELKALAEEFGPLFDPCPYPRPDGFDGLEMEWGPVSYVNPLFYGYIDRDGKKRGITAWVRKALLEQSKGKTVIMALPVDGWVRLLIGACAPNADIRFKPDWLWGTPKGEWRKPSRPLLLWVLRPRRITPDKRQDCMSKGGSFLGVHEPKQTADGWWFCKCGWRRGRAYTIQSVKTHIGKGRELAARVARA